MRRTIEHKEHAEILPPEVDIYRAILIPLANQSIDDFFALLCHEIHPKVGIRGIYDIPLLLNRAKIADTREQVSSIHNDITTRLCESMFCCKYSCLWTQGIHPFIR